MYSSRLAVVAFGATAVASTPSTAQAPAASGQRIELYSYGYRPSPLVLAAGKPVTLTFVNRAGKGHDFTAKQFFASSKILSGSAPGGEVDLSGGGSTSITLVPTAGTYKVHCAKPFHTMFGMTEQIIVR